MKNNIHFKYDSGMKRVLTITLFLILLSLACSLGGSNDAAAPANTQGGQVLPDGESPPAATPLDKQPGDQPTTTLGPDCYGDEVHPIGQEIASLYEDTSYEEVMTWFCNGFLFEDILTALQTAEETNETAVQLLARFENGQTWEEIWVELGVLEE